MAYLLIECELCQAYEFTASTRIRLEIQVQALIATFNMGDHALLSHGHIGKFIIALQRLPARDGDIMDDISAHRDSDIEIVSAGG